MNCLPSEAANPDGARFCVDCGVRLALICPACGMPSRESKKVGNSCETPVSTSRGSLEDERKQLTVLFADIRGSMELVADLDPEVARAILDPVLHDMLEAVHRYDGTVNQVMGDGIMALFGAPLALEDHAVRACYAALRMQTSARRYAERVRQTGGGSVQIRVGLNSGEVVVRSIGSDLHPDYSAVGQVTHLAARLEQMAAPGSILISPSTLALAEGYVQVTPLGPLPVRGLKTPLEVYELTGAGTLRSRMEIVAARGLTRFGGRDAELEALRQALDRACAGHGQVVGVVGEPGVGKSRLFWEFIHSHHTDGWLVLESGLASYGRGTPYLPVIDILKLYFEVEPRDDPRAIYGKLAAKLVTGDPGLQSGLQSALPAFLALLAVPVDNPHWQSLDPHHRRERTLEALKDLLHRESQKQPVCIVLEDLHWIDSETQAFLDNLIESLPTARILVLVNYRPEYQHAWGSKTFYTQLRIDPLPPARAEDLLRSLLGSDPGLQPLMRQLIDRTGGNPLFLEESVRTLLETRVLAGERGAYRLATAFATVQVPATVQALLAARIDRLPPDDKRLLQTAAVIGEEVPLALLRSIADEPEDILDRRLKHLQEAEFLYQARRFPQLAYAFKHGLTYRVAYASLLHDRRRFVHARIVETIERLSGERLAEETERLAHHAFHGEMGEKAVGYLRSAGLRAMARAAPGKAVAYLEQAVEVLGRLPERRDTIELAIDLRLDLRSALLPLGDWERMQHHLRTAESLAAALGDQRRLGRVSSYMVLQCVLAQEYAEALRFGQQALAIGSALDDTTIAVSANAYLGLAHVSRGDHIAALEHLGRNIGPITADLGDERFGQATSMASLSRSILSLALAGLGRFGEAIHCAEQARCIAEKAGHRYSLAFAWWSLGETYAARGDFTLAGTVLARCLDLCRTSEFHALMPATAASLALGLTRNGRAAEALALAEEVAAIPRTQRLHAEQVLVSLGSTYLLAGRADQATAWANRALEGSRRHGARAGEAGAMYLAGEIALLGDANIGEAADHYSQALALADGLGMRPLIAHCELALARLSRRIGEREETEKRLTAATEMYREMGMRYWLERAESEHAMLARAADGAGEEDS